MTYYNKMNRPNDVSKTQQDLEFSKNWDMRLSPNEIAELERLTLASNTLQLSSQNYKNPLNMSLKDLFKEWTTANLKVINDIIKFMTNISDYNQYFEDIDQTRQWLEGVLLIIKNFIKIFTIENRSLYVGFTILLISLLLWYIDIIENK
jgi:molecular chaperone GrpE (heat shock protein)